MIHPTDIIAETAIMEFNEELYRYGKNIQTIKDQRIKMEELTKDTLEGCNFPDLDEETMTSLQEDYCIFFNVE